MGFSSSWLTLKPFYSPAQGLSSNAFFTTALTRNISTVQITKGRRQSPAFCLQPKMNRAHFSDAVLVTFVSDFFSFSVATRFARVSRTFPLTPLNVSGGPPLPMRAE